MVAAGPRLARFFCLTASLIRSTSNWYLEKRATLRHHDTASDRPSVRYRPFAIAHRALFRLLQRRLERLHALHRRPEPLLQLGQFAAEVRVVSDQLLVHLRQLVQVVFEERDFLLLGQRAAVLLVVLGGEVLLHAGLQAILVTDNHTTSNATALPADPGRTVSGDCAESAAPWRRCLRGLSDLSWLVLVARSWYCRIYPGSASGHTTLTERLVRFRFIFHVNQKYYAQLLTRNTELFIYLLRCLLAKRLNGTRLLKIVNNFIASYETSSSNYPLPPIRI
jgi:hypothetical protein